MSDGFRWEIEASAGPTREAPTDGGAQLLVRVRLFDEGVEDPQPDAFTDLRPHDARHLALELLAAADDAERQSLDADRWEPPR
jgi:hypothetical protein